MKRLGLAAHFGDTSPFGGVPATIGTFVAKIIGRMGPSRAAERPIIIRVQPYWRMIAVGAVLVAAAALDQWRRHSQSRG